MRIRKGFTLVELLVVIGIIAILISLLLPALKRAKESGQRAGCLSNMKQLMIAQRMYAEDWKGRLPPVNSKGSPAPYPGWLYANQATIDSNNEILIQLEIKNGQLYKYLKSAKPFRCPMDEPPFSRGYVHYITSYCMNREVMEANSPGSYKAPYESNKLVKFKADDIIMWEQDELADAGNWNDGNNIPTQVSNGRPEAISARHGAAKSTLQNSNAGGIVGCVDGRAEWITTQEFERLRREDPRRNRLLCNPTRQ